MKTTLAKNGYLSNAENIAFIQSALNWLDMKTPVSKNSESVLDAFCDLLQDKLVYEEGERDMVAMHHEFGIKWASGKTEKRMSTMITYGDPNSYSAMAKTVGLPAAMATDMLLSSKFLFLT